mgnify:CR=1 FL=1
MPDVDLVLAPVSGGGLISGLAIALGTLGAIEVALTLQEKGYRNKHPLWVTLWCDEENGLTGMEMPRMVTICPWPTPSWISSVRSGLLLK